MRRAAQHDSADAQSFDRGDGDGDLSRPFARLSKLLDSAKYRLDAAATVDVLYRSERSASAAAGYATVSTFCAAMAPPVVFPSLSASAGLAEHAACLRPG